MSVHEFIGPGVDGGSAADPDDEQPPVRPTSLADSPFEALRQAMAVPLPKEHLAISPLHRPEVEVRLRSNVSLDEMNEWRKGAKDPAFAGGVSMVRFVCILLANSSVDILINGRSTEMTLADPKIKAMYPEAADEVEAVRAFFGNEDLWLSSRLLPELTQAWSGGEQEGELVRPTTLD